MKIGRLIYSDPRKNSFKKGAEPKQVCCKDMRT